MGFRQRIDTCSDQGKRRLVIMLLLGLNDRDILLQIPGATYRDFLTEDKSMMALAGAHEKTADDRTAGA